MPDRKYDIAFSFLTADLPLAQRLEDALVPLRSFVYAERQGDIITRDGMDVFSAAFGTESRLNVVLYRAGYGEQGWTNFEREIIRGRCLANEGWASFALIRTDGSPVPGWIPPTYIYGDAALMDVEALAGVLRVRAQTVGANVQPQTASTRLARLASDRQFNDETERLATGREAFDEVSENLAAIHSRISGVIAEHGGRNSGLAGESGGKGSIFGANLGRTGCYINYENQFGSVTHGKIKIRLLDGRIAIPGTRQIQWEEATELSRFEGSVTRSRALGWCWLFRGQPHTSVEVADLVLDELIRRNR